jgi:hypothetical protein
MPAAEPEVDSDNSGQSDSITRFNSIIYDGDLYKVSVTHEDPKEERQNAKDMLDGFLAANPHLLCSYWFDSQL